MKNSRIHSRLLNEALDLLGADSLETLSELYRDEDQKLMNAQKWDFENSTLVVNKIKTLLEKIDPNELTEEEQKWRNNILWFWYHHAISCAVWRYGDQKKAYEFAKKALEYQPKNHPNKITRLFYLLLSDKTTEAHQWSANITDEPEKTTAKRLIKEYEDNHFNLNY